MATASLAVNQNTKLAFRVVTTEAFGQNDISVGALIIPYSTYVKFNKGHVRYQFEIQALPKTVGSIIIESTAPEVPPPVYEKKISPFFTLNSRKRHGGVDLQQTCSLSATPGKKIVHGSQNITWIKNKGKRSFSFQEVTEKTVSYLAKTYHHRAKDSHSGKLCFSIDFMEYNEPDPKMVPKQMPLELEWNGSKALPLPGKTWKVIFKPFDGSPAKEFASAYFDDPYIDIVVEGNNLRISTKEARKIKHFQSMRKLTISNIESDTAAELVKRITMEQQLFSLIASFGAGAAIGYYIARSRL
jgi:hypothetical protein